MRAFKTPLLASVRINFTLFIVLIVLHTASSGRGFNLQRYCRSQCNIGLGGNLCRCNAFHFAGKRAGVNAPSRGQPSSGLASSSSVSEETPEDSAQRPAGVAPGLRTWGIASQLKNAGKSGSSEVFSDDRRRHAQRNYKTLLSKLYQAIKDQRKKRF